MSANKITKQSPLVFNLFSYSMKKAINYR